MRDRIDKHALYVNMYVTLRRWRREITFFWVMCPFERTFCSTTLIISIFRSSPIINSFAQGDHNYATPYEKLCKLWEIFMSLLSFLPRLKGCCLWVALGVQFAKRKDGFNDSQANTAADPCHAAISHTHKLQIGYFSLSKCNLVDAWRRINLFCKVVSRA